jgi:ubiquinone/menaquinone biosynthesis C-methylase UbiE
MGINKGNSKPGMKDSKLRFSNRVENYVKYRPHYPQEIITLLKEKIKLSNHWEIADIGSGTGISSELFIKNGNRVYGVEPNNEMRLAAEKYFSLDNNFISIKGSAGDTTLKSNSIDLLISGQAFHWFDRKKARLEFMRILKKDRYVVIFWNQRKTDDTEFQCAYEAFLRKYCEEYGKVTQKNITAEEFTQFYGTTHYGFESVNNSQKFNFEGLKGRLQSSSYSPHYDNKIYPEMIDSLYALFRKYSVNNQVVFEYNTEIYCGTLLSG